jgi:hypothetical protein
MKTYAVAAANCWEYVRTMHGATYRDSSIVHAMSVLSEESARSFHRSSRWLGLIALVALVASGCATPIGVRYVEPRVAYHSLTANVLSAERPSSFSARELMNLNLYERFEEEPEKALAEMHSGLASKGDEDRVFALAELSFVHAQNSGERSYYLASAVYAYAFLLPGQHGTQPRGIDPRYRWAADIYNQALTRAAMLDDREHPVPRGGTFKLPFGEITVEFD